jgi:hypothetical protein
MNKGQENLRIALRDNLNINFYKVDGKGGTPNIHYLGKGDWPTGWMEIIHLGEWDKRVSTGLRLEQANWMQDYINNGGSAWVVARVGPATCLFWGECAASLLDRPSPKRFMETATWSKNGNLSKEDWKHVENMILNANSVY